MRLWIGSMSRFGVVVGTGAGGDVRQLLEGADGCPVVSAEDGREPMNGGGWAMMWGKRAAPKWSFRVGSRMSTSSESRGR